MKTKILGSGGAFDIAEGNSSFVVNVENLNILVDCGWSVYPILKKAGVINDIDAVCITHTHDDHIGSLSNLIFDRWYLHNKTTIIITNQKVEEVLTRYLMGIVGVEPDMVIFLDDTKYVTPIDTTGLHYPLMPSCGFHFKHNEETLIISGDIGVPIDFAPSLDLSKLDPNLTTIFHDVTDIARRDFPHCHYSMLEQLAQSFFVFGYHNNVEQELKIAMNSDINSVRFFK